MKTQAFKCSVSKNNKKKEKNITLEGDLSLKNIKQIKSKLQKETNTKDKLNIYIKNTENIDITIIQLLISITNEHKNITIDSDIPDAVKAVYFPLRYLIFCQRIKQYGNFPVL